MACLRLRRTRAVSAGPEPRQHAGQDQGFGTGADPGDLHELGGVAGVGDRVAGHEEVVLAAIGEGQLQCRAAEVGAAVGPDGAAGVGQPDDGRQPGSGGEVSGPEVGGQIGPKGEFGVVHSDDDLGVERAAGDLRAGFPLVRPLDADDDVRQVTEVGLGLR